MKTENLPTRFISDVDHVAEETVHPVPTEGHYQYEDSVQIMVHKHGSFLKGLYQAAIRFQTRSHKLFQVRIFSARIIKIG